MILTVIIPTYNRVNLIKFTLDSLNEVHHKGVHLEIIVVDDGSTDGTKDFIAHHYPGVILLDNKGKGAAAARNTGLAAATGKYIVYLDSDDLIGRDYFKQKTDLLERSPEISACYGLYDVFESDGEMDAGDIVFRHKYPVIASGDKTRDHLLNYLSGNFLPPHAIVWRKSLLLECAGHDESLGINQDVDLFIRAIFHGLKIITLQDDETRVYVRSHSLDTRVGDPKNAVHKWVQILDLRKKIFAELQSHGYAGADIYQAISSYLFGYWRSLRHTQPAIAAEYLDFAKRVYWPVTLKGGWGYRYLARVVGPEWAVKMKYFLLKHD